MYICEGRGRNLIDDGREAEALKTLDRYHVLPANLRPPPGDMPPVSVYRFLALSPKAVHDAHAELLATYRLDSWATIESLLTPGATVVTIGFQGVLDQVQLVLGQLDQGHVMATNAARPEHYTGERIHEDVPTQPTKDPLSSYHAKNRARCPMSFPHLTNIV